MYKLQTNMNLVEKHTVEVSQKINKAESKAKQQLNHHSSSQNMQDGNGKNRFQLIGSPTPDKRFGPKIRISNNRRAVGASSDNSGIILQRAAAAAKNNKDYGGGGGVTKGLGGIMNNAVQQTSLNSDI